MCKKERVDFVEALQCAREAVRHGVNDLTIPERVRGVHEATLNMIEELYDHVVAIEAELVDESEPLSSAMTGIADAIDNAIRQAESANRNEIAMGIDFARGVAQRCRRYAAVEAAREAGSE